MKKHKMNCILCTCLVSVFITCFALSSCSTSEKETGSVTIRDNATIEDVDTPEEEPEETTTADIIQYEITHTTFTHQMNTLGREEYCGVVEITNTGTTCLYLDDCTFDFEDNNGHLLQSEKYITSAPSVIAPNEKGYFFSSGWLDEGVSLDNGINLVPVYTIAKCEDGEDAIIDYDISDLDIRDEDYDMGVKITGRITNNTNEETNSIDVMIVAVFYDSNGDILAVDFTYADAMSAGGQSSFEISTMFGNDSLTTDEVADYQVFARHDYYQF